MLALEAWAMVGIHVCGTTWSVAVTVARRLLLQLLAGRCRWPKRSGRQGRLFSDFIEYCNLCCAYVLARIL